MYLSKLELHGFKSFAEPTTLTFDPGVTTIVGPNGCGKSNIVDAVRWVIGEQRPTVLRSEKMENVIFNGTVDRKPLGMAEVQLTIENNRGVLPTEYAEVTIGRRLFRDGTSEYLMNGTECRLKDITDLFMDTGMGADAYSVIELKMIDEILSGSTEDRRRMFEEAAGITRYKMRRRQALRKLDNTRSDLERIRDLTDEISTQVDRLKRQAEKAKQYNEAEEKLQRLELLLAQVEYERLTDNRHALAEQQQSQSDRADTLEAKERAAEDRLERLRGTLDERERTLQERRDALQEHRARVRELEAEQRLQRERLDRARSDRDTALQAQEEAADERARLVDQAEQVQETLARARPALDEAEEALNAARDERDAAKTAAADLREQARAMRRKTQKAEDEQAERRRTLDRLTNRHELHEEELERAQTQLSELQEKADTLDRRLTEATTDREAAQERLEDARHALDRAEAERREREQTLADAEGTLRELERERDACRAEVDLLEGLVSSYDEFSDAVQHLAAEGPVDDLQTVADVLACDEADRVALDAALGNLASCIVVPSDTEARRAIAHLREADQGQATFLVLDRLSDPPHRGAEVEEADALRPQVRVTQKAYAALADTLLHNCYVTDTLDDAQAAAETSEFGARILARTGEWVDARGVVRGGSQQASASPVASRLGRREQLERAREQQSTLQQQCAAQHERVDAVRQALEALDLDPYDDEVRDAEEALRQADKQEERIRYERATIGERREELRERIEALEATLADEAERIASLREEAAGAEDDLAALRKERDRLDEALDAAEERERAAVDAFSDANVAAVQARNRVDNLERELERTQERIRAIDRQSEQRATEIDRLKARIEEALDEQSALDKKIEALRGDRDEHDSAVAAAEEAVADTKSAVNEVEQRLRQLRQEREAAVRKENEASVRLAEVETRTEDLTESIREDYERDLAENPVAVPDDFDEDEAQSKVRSLRGRINAIGSVNPLALEEYEEEKERLDFLLEQKQDLEDAEATLLETIEEINTTAAERFFETFDEIKDSFSQIFAELFGEGASAKLQLEEPDDPLDSAIEIVAKPRGKRPTLLDQLSSGEKTLTATALLFAIYLVKPSPFCILDEVDAPLDDANVERFMSLIRRFEDDTQFILVTHNQRTMALADRMYGITMEEQGVSKLVGVDFDEAVEMAG
jgi:chromosome segregation protein